MFNPPNALSLLRGPLALLFLFDNQIARFIAVLLALISDSIDGFLARRFGSSSRLGAFLDPVMDKFFVYFTMLILISESKLFLWQACLMISRDFFLCLFGIYISLTGAWKTHQLRSIVTGKISTALQFAALFAFSLGFVLPTFYYFLFALLGVFVFLELLQHSRLQSN